MTEQEHRYKLQLAHLLAVLRECENIKHYADDISKWLEMYGKERSWQLDVSVSRLLFYLETDLNYSLFILDNLKKNVGLYKWVD